MFPSPHLKTETDIVSETLCLGYWMMDTVQKMANLYAADTEAKSLSIPLFQMMPEQQF
jgi:hypothetical protein